MPMADEERDIDLRRDGVSFEQDPLEFCQMIYDEAAERAETLAPINTENMKFYEGIDDNLTARANNAKVKRSAIYVHELTPAIDTRVGAPIAKIEEQKVPISIKPKASNPSPKDKAGAIWIETEINRQMRESGYLTGVFGEQVLAGEINRSPSIVKVGWNTDQTEVPVKKMQGKWQVIESILAGRSPVQVVWEKRDIGMPYAEWMHPEDMLYEPHKSSVGEGTYFIHRMWLEKHEIMALAKEFDFDENVMREFNSMAEDPEEPGDDSGNSQRDEIEDAKGTSFEDAYRDGKYLVTENYVVHYDDDGEKLVDRCWVLGNKFLAKQERSPYRGITFPMVDLVMNRLPGTAEGLSSIDRGKHLQRLYNELYNAYIDWMTYGMFPPLKAPMGFAFEGKPKFGPGEIWKCSSPEDLTPVVQVNGRAPATPELLQSIAAKIQQLVSAMDLSQGFQGQAYEKATSTKARMMGAERRSVPNNKTYGRAIIRVAEMYLRLNQIYSPEKDKFVLDVVIDVPALTAATDPETEKQELLLLLNQAMQNPIYQTPSGQRKIRNIMQEVMEKFLRRDVTDFVPTAEEQQQDLTLQAEMQAAAIEKQAAMEQIQLTAQSAAQSQEQGNEVPVQ